MELLYLMRELLLAEQKSGLPVVYPQLRLLDSIQYREGGIFIFTASAFRRRARVMMNM